MTAVFAAAVARWSRIRRPVTFSVAAMLLLAFGATAHGDPITIFSDDFEGYGTGTDPTSPPVGEPWQISEVVAQGIDIALSRVDQLPPGDRVLLFGPYRNKALAPFSATGREQIAQAQNATISFDYYGFSAGGFSQYFDVAAYDPISYDPISGDPAFLIRFAPEENPESGGLHDIYYLDPADGLVDSSLDIRMDSVQAVTITADFTGGTYELDVEGEVATLPMFVCPEEIVGVEFANYGGAIGSGSIDNLRVTVEDAGASVPELATITLLAMGGLTLAAWVWWREDTGQT